MRTQLLAGSGSLAILLASCGSAQGALPRTPNEWSADLTKTRSVGAAPLLDTVGNYRAGADLRLIHILRCAAGRHPEYRVKAVSGFRPGDRRFHGRRMAVDIALVDAVTGRGLPNYQRAAAFRAYERFAQSARACQSEHHPELDEALRWGGYFAGGPGKYGAVDLMHFDLGGSSIPMGGGSWATGLGNAQRRLWPDAVSIGMKAAGGTQAGSRRKGPDERS